MAAEISGKSINQWATGILRQVKSMLAERVKEWTQEWKEEGIQQGIHPDCE